MTGSHGFWLLALLAMHALAAGTETALRSVDRLRLHHLAKSGYAEAAALEALLREPKIFRNFVGIAVVLLRVAVILGIVVPTETWDTPDKWAFRIGAVVVLAAVGEALPRTWFMRRPIDRLSRLIPLIRLVNRCAAAVSGRSRKSESAGAEVGGKEFQTPLVTRESLIRLIRDGVETGAISDIERGMIARVLTLQSCPVEQSMVPIEKVVAVTSETTLEEFSRICRETGYIRMPVRDLRTGGYVGIINVFFVVGRELDSSQHVGEFMRAPLFVPKELPMSDLLPMMRRNRQPMALVRDRDGQVVGMVSIDDVLAAVVGRSADAQA